MTKIKHSARKMSAFKAVALTSTAIAGLALPSVAMADDWTGATNSSWFDAGNWNPAHVPTAADDVTINHTSGLNLFIVGVGSDAVANKITIGKSGVDAAILTLNAGATLTTTSAVLGDQANSEGNVAIGAGGSIVPSYWTNAGDLIIGNLGHGGLAISNGTVSDTNAVVSAQAGSTGFIGVLGVNAKWLNSGSLTIGGQGSATLQIANGGTVKNTSTGIIGEFVGSDGTVNVNGTGSSWTNGDLYVGGSGSGTLNILNGGSVSNSSGTVGTAAGSEGVVTVDGTNSIWTTSGALIVSNGGLGTLTITNGGSVVNDLGIIGNFDPAVEGTVNVTGGGSSWINGGSTAVGYFGRGILNVTNGGNVVSAATAAGSPASIGYGLGSYGQAVVDGAGSGWNVNAQLDIGTSGLGELTVSNGGLVTATGGIVIAANAHSIGDLHIGDGGGAGKIIAPTVKFGDGDGRITFDHTDTAYSFDAAVSGAGTIHHEAGVTHLTGDSSGFTGDTDLFGGTLMIDGKLGTGVVNVYGGAVLGGFGAINGDVIVGPAATLRGQQGQTLTMGSLLLNDGALVDATFATAGGSALFDITNNLTLDGTLNLTAGGVFGPGVYSLMTYGGALTDNGLDIGTTPVGSTAGDYVVQTSVAGQVNLVSNALATLAFWDGDAAGNASNNAVNGGQGVWTATSANWTDVSGSTNGVMHPQPGFAIFQGIGGLVSVDNSAGDIAVTGMQFAADGYRVGGGPITLANANAIIRVGDGSASGAGYTAAIDSVLTGAGALEKTDLGTLVLTGANTYAGGTKISGGTLKLGDGGASGSVIGDIEVGGTLAFNRSDVSTFAGTISGGGLIAHDGPGTTNLTGNSNGYAGNVLINHGALGIVNGGTLNANTIFAAAHAGETSALGINGAGSVLTSQSLVIGGGGSANLAVGNGAKVSTNVAVIGLAAGGNGSATVSGAGSTWANATHIVVGSDGSGALTVADGGAVTAGETIILAEAAGSSGTLNIGAAAGSQAVGAGTVSTGALEFGSGTGTLNFNHTSTNHVFAAAMSGAGTINQIAGNTSLTGASNGFTGTVNVNGGRLAVNGALAGGQVKVKNGGTLGGNGVIGSLSAEAGAIVAPGNSIGTLNVVGNASFAAGSTYQVELGSNGQADLLNVGGTATIANGAALRLIKADASPYLLGQHYELLTAAGGLTGKFTLANVKLTNFIGLVGGSDADSFYIDVALTKTFASAGASANEVAIGGALDSLPLTSVLTGAVANLADDASAQGAFNALSGELYASVKGVMVDNSRMIREAATDRLRNATNDGEPRSVWGRFVGSWGTAKGDRNASRVDHNDTGFLIGADGMVGEDWRLGVVGGYSHSNFDGRAASANADNYHIGLYAGTQYSDFKLRAGLAYSWHNVSMTRNVAFAGFSDALTADYKARTAQAFAEVGYAVNAGSVALEPFAGLAYVGLSTKGFAEKGGAAALTGRRDHTNVPFATIGSRAVSDIKLGNGWNLVARGSLGYRHAFGDTTPHSAMAFAGSSAFDIQGAPISRDAAVVDLGLDAQVSKNATVGFSYAGQFGSGSSVNALHANFVVKF